MNDDQINLIQGALFYAQDLREEIRNIDIAKTRKDDIRDYVTAWVNNANLIESLLEQALET